MASSVRVSIVARGHCRRCCRQRRSRNRHLTGVGNFWRWRKPPCSSSKMPARPGRRAPASGRSSGRLAAGRRAHSGTAATWAATPIGLLAQFAPRCSRHRRGDLLDQLAELRGREVGPAVEGPPVGVRNDRHRPAAVAGQRLHGVHVDGVQVGPLFAVDLDADEVAVQEVGDAVVVERLLLHHMAPVAAGVADRQEDGPVCAAAARQAPRRPRDTSPPDCGRAGAGRARARRATGCPACG